MHWQTFTQLFREEHSIMPNKYWVKINNNDQIKRAHWTLGKIIEQIVRILYLNQALIKYTISFVIMFYSVNCVQHSHIEKD